MEYWEREPKGGEFMSRSTRTRTQENLCPRCRKLAERYTISITNGREAPELGSPRHRCPYCGYIYYDGHFCEAEYWEYFLTLDPDGALFERHARSHGMSPAHFRDHCRAMAAKGRERIEQ